MKNRAHPPAASKDFSRLRHLHSPLVGSSQVIVCRFIRRKMCVISSTRIRQQSLVNTGLPTTKSMDMQNFRQLRLPINELSSDSRVVIARTVYPIQQLAVRIQGPSMLCGPYCLYFLNERPLYPTMTALLDSACYPFRKLQHGEDCLVKRRN